MITASAWYMLRTLVGDMVVRDDTGEPPESWPCDGRRRFALVAVVQPPPEPSRHNHAQRGAPVLSVLGVAWVEMKHLAGVPVPVQQLSETATPVQTLAGYGSQIVKPSTQEAEAFGHGPRLVDK